MTQTWVDESFTCFHVIRVLAPFCHVCIFRIKSYSLIYRFRLVKEFDRELKDEEGRNPPEVNKQLNDEKQSMVSIWNLLSLHSWHEYTYAKWRHKHSRSVIHYVKWWAAYFFAMVLLVSLILFVFLLMRLHLMSQYFTFADQRAEFICGIEKNVSWLIHFLFRGHEFGSELSCVKFSF